jgi:hypothetical protein
LKGLATYDLLCGEGDANFDLAIARTKQQQEPAADLLRYAGGLADRGERLLGQFQKGLTAGGNDPAKAMAELREDCRLLAEAGKKLREIRDSEPPLRAALETAGASAHGVESDFVAAQSDFSARSSRAGTLLALVADDSPKWAREAPWHAELRKSAAALADAEMAGEFSAATAALKAGKSPQAAEAAVKLAGLMRAHARTIRTAVEALRTRKAPAERLDQDSALWPETLRRALRRVRSLQADLSSPAGAGGGGYLLLAAGRDIGRAAELRADGIGLAWARQAGADQRLAVAAIREPLPAGQPAAAPAVAHAPVPAGQPISLRPPGRDARASDYGRLPSGVLAELNNTGAEPMPPEIVVAWERYLWLLRNPPRPEPAAGGSGR